MQINEAAAAFLNQRRACRRRAATIDQYRYQLLDLWLPWRVARGLPTELTAVTRVEVDAYIVYLREEHVNQRTGQRGLADETITSSWRTLRAFWSFAAEQGWLAADQHDHFRQRQPCPRQPAPRAAVGADSIWSAVQAACAALEDREERARNRAILSLLRVGVRVTVLAELQDGAVDLRERRAHVAPPEGRVRWVTWGYEAAVALRAYLRVRGGPKGGPLFRSTTALLAGQPLSGAAIRRVVYRMAALAGVEPALLMHWGTRR